MFYTTAALLESIWIDRNVVLSFFINVTQYDCCRAKRVLSGLKCSYFKTKRDTKMMLVCLFRIEGIELN